MALGLFAHRDILKNKPPIDSLETLANYLEIIGPDRSKPDLELLKHIFPEAIEPRLSIRTDNHLASFAAIQAGLGVGVVQVPVGNATQNLTRLLPEYEVARLVVWLVMREDLRHEAHSRTVFNHLL